MQIYYFVSFLLCQTIFEYKQFLAYTITLLGEKYYDGLRLAELIFQYEKKIAYIVAPFRDLIPPSDLVEVMTIADIKRVAEHVWLFYILKRNINIFPMSFDVHFTDTFNGIITRNVAEFVNKGRRPGSRILHIRTPYLQHNICNR